jgi:hypothetical protein
VLGEGAQRPLPDDSRRVLAAHALGEQREAALQPPLPLEGGLRDDDAAYDDGNDPHREDPEGAVDRRGRAQLARPVR